MKKFIILLLSACFLFSCTTYREVSAEPDYERWLLGNTYEQVIMSQGIPNRVVPDGNGGRVMIYEDNSPVMGATEYQWTGNSPITGSYGGKYLHVFIDEDSVCYLVKTNRYNEEKVFSVGKTIGLVAGLSGGSLLLILNLLSEYHGI